MYISVSRKTNPIHKILASAHGKLQNCVTRLILLCTFDQHFVCPLILLLGFSFNFPALEVTLNCSHLVLTSDSEMILQSPLTFGVSIRIAPVCDPERRSCPSHPLFLVKVVMVYVSLLFA